MTTGHTDIYVGDALAVLQTLPAESVQCIVTSPPYYALRDYGEDGQLGLEATPAEYVANLVAVFREARRVLRDDGVCWLNLGDSFGGKQLLGIPWRVAFALQDDGWWLRSDVIWAKPNPMPESVTDRPTKAHEYVFLLSKSAWYFYDAEGVAEDSARPDLIGKPNGHWGSPDEGKGTRASALGKIASGNEGNNAQVYYYGTRNRRTVWTIATQPYSGAHFATMPPDLAEVCIKAGSSERGCCPECGAPWERVTEKEYLDNGTPRQDRQTATGGAITGGVGKNFRTVQVNFGGWQPTCDHDAEPVNCTVLDPFGGAGTTALVANRLGRDAIIIELNPDYAELARRRIIDDAPMFASVDVIAAKEAALS